MTRLYRYSVKVGMMGPLAGVGDPVFWFTARPILGALGASLALSGKHCWTIIILRSMELSSYRILMVYTGIRFIKVGYFYC